MNMSTVLKIIEASEAVADDDLDIPDSLRVENRRPLSPEAQAKLGASLKAAKEKAKPLDDAAKAVLAEVTAKKKQKREVKKEKAVADKTGATKAMPLSGAAALAAIEGPKAPKKAKKGKAAKKAGKAAKAPPKKAPAQKARKAGKVDRSPATVGAFICSGGAGGVAMQSIEKRFDMDAHPLRAKIFAARHELGFDITYDAKTKRYVGKAPKAKAR